MVGCDTWCVSDEHAVVVGRIIEMIRERRTVPAEVSAPVETLIDAWESGTPDPEALLAAKTALWTFLEDKHGTSTVIQDEHDRAVRAALCLAEPVGTSDPADLLEWATSMLRPTE